MDKSKYLRLYQEMVVIRRLEERAAELAERHSSPVTLDPAARENWRFLAPVHWSRSS